MLILEPGGRRGELPRLERYTLMNDSLSAFYHASNARAGDCIRVTLRPRYFLSHSLMFCMHVSCIKLISAFFHASSPAQLTLPVSKWRVSASAKVAIRTSLLEAS
jgi:hypothetical protein